MRWKRKDWHRWWAWRPIKVEDGTWVWLEYVERRFDDTATAWSIAPNSGVVFYTKGYVYKRLVPNFGVTEFQDHNGVYGPAGARHLTLRFHRGTDTVEIELVVQKVTSSKADATLLLRNMESK